MAQAQKHPQKLLLFHLNDQRLFGLGTLKIREIIPFQPLSKLPNSHPSVVGTMSFRGSVVPVIDTGAAVGYAPTSKDQLQASSIIIADLQRMEIGLAVHSVSKIIEAEWKEVTAPPKSLGQSAFVTGLLREEDGTIIQLMDVELLLSRVFPESIDSTQVRLTDVDREAIKRLNILLVDDSKVARRQLADALDAASATYSMTSNGQEALDILLAFDREGKPIDVLVSDIEMPGLDGYELTFSIRDDSKLTQPYIILHTSLNSEMSVSYAKQVGADEALTKFDARELMQAILGATKDR
ncbi:chemotaxis protein CheW [Oleiphilus sp. HI0071]|uniref:chemotaxis protein n=1 Tax=unclassified Oleiphilus TaxID=2631174 RepID=UPI0007C25A69|nr:MULTISPECIES: chemotaxis protein [unclassified Oleiphilus]KZY64698.1 chemotaxis protein CheW [Oleiphilus sp. HI0065]KZY79190.1 chemotaxis protein CheW [Oleiphilus sp. HI0071]KZZ04951.1 chemotaxis protein CheW [Oleiphilus sp. HI0073]KZZ40067.1 chemotaxis protein CheW [Oleiphilus sp. HI0118]KZZ55097.1 chemotaxis protein CheW [Oleiphilus sp. HI0122]KZZ78017.1 chemotaxis protein CheW [Oleiphilus sp. HI0130]KZZ80957.1 chemotaxis protein CheW [Oleiphilus sp. HI0133]